MIVSPILSNNITSFTKANEEGFSKLQLDEPEKGDKDISFEEVKSREKIGNHSIMKIKIANKKLLNYYQDQFLNYAKEKLNITPSNLPITDVKTSFIITFLIKQFPSYNFLKRNPIIHYQI